MLICTKAFYDLLIEKLVGKSKIDWEKTEHLGKGNRYIDN
jgi:hypothetical protein